MTAHCSCHTNLSQQVFDPCQALEREKEFQSHSNDFPASRYYGINNRLKAALFATNLAMINLGISLHTPVVCLTPQAVPAYLAHYTL